MRLLTCGRPAIFRDSIHFETRYFNVRSVYSPDGTLNRNKSNLDFSGPPRPELEEAWNNILDCECEQPYLSIIKSLTNPYRSKFPRPRI